MNPLISKNVASIIFDETFRFICRTYEMHIMYPTFYLILTKNHLIKVFLTDLNIIMIQKRGYVDLSEDSGFVFINDKPSNLDHLYFHR